MRNFTLEDGFALSAILDKTNLQLDLNAFMDSAKDGNQAYFGGQLVLALLKKMHLAKDDIIKLMADMSGEPIEEVKGWGIDKMKTFFSELFSNAGLADFFQISSRRTDIEDLLLHRYGNIEYILRMPLLNAARLINKAAEEERKEIFYRRWLVRFTNMDKETYIPFEEYYESTKPKN